MEMDNVDLHSYVVLSDGRAYTAISQLPEPLGWALMPLAPVGGLFGWLFALELPDHKNGFRITGKALKLHYFSFNDCVRLYTGISACGSVG